MKNNNEELEQIESRIRTKYGEILTTKDIAEALLIPTADAVTKAFSQGRLPVKLTQFPGRRGFYASAGSVARALYEFKQFEEQS